MESRMKLHCASCGSDQFDIPSDPKPDDVVACAGCSGTIRYADLQASSLKQAKELVEKSLRDMFRK